MEEKIKLINQVVSSYFETNKDVKEIPAKDLMPEFIKKGVFNADPKKGLNIRKVLRKLDKTNDLHLIPKVHPERKKVNTYWYFKA